MARGARRAVNKEANESRDDKDARCGGRRGERAVASPRRALCRIGGRRRRAHDAQPMPILGAALRTQRTVRHERGTIKSEQAKREGPWRVVWALPFSVVAR